MPNQMLLLRGQGYDMEDGILADDVLSWTSSLEGALGNGSSLTTSGLRVGTHTITLAVTDSNGNVGTETIQVFIGAKVYLPIMLRNH